MSFLDEAERMGVTVRKMGNSKTLCPKCSSGRKNKTDRCLSITYTGQEILWNCHNCGFKGALHAGSETNPMAGSKRAGSGDRIKAWCKRQSKSWR